MKIYIKKVFKIAFPVVLVSSAYFLGVHNERAFPGDRRLPADGEGWYWLGLLLLVVLAVSFPKIRDRIFRK